MPHVRAHVEVTSHNTDYVELEANAVWMDGRAQAGQGGVDPRAGVRWCT